MITRRAFLKFGASIAAALAIKPAEMLASDSFRPAKALPMRYWVEIEPKSGPFNIPDIRHYLAISRIPDRKVSWEWYGRFNQCLGQINDKFFLGAERDRILFVACEIQRTVGFYVDGEPLALLPSFPEAKTLTEITGGRSVEVANERLLTLQFAEREVSWNAAPHPQNAEWFYVLPDIFPRADFNALVTDLRKAS